MLKNELCNMKVILTVLLSQPRTNRELERCAIIHNRSYLNSSAYKSTAGSISIVWHPSREGRTNFRLPSRPDLVDVQSQAGMSY